MKTEIGSACYIQWLQASRFFSWSSNLLKQPNAYLDLIHSRHTHRQEVPIEAVVSVIEMGAEIETASSTLGAKAPDLTLVYVMPNHK